MSSSSDWWVWLLAAALIALFGWYFWHVARSLLGGFVAAARTIQNWPQTRRALVEAEAKAGGRYPWWYRAARVVIVLCIVGLAAYLVYRRFQ
jgi:cytochrome c-type biogenesis protein CcmH/NrfG